MAKATVKKKWFTIIAPKLFNEVVIGETPAFEAKAIKDKSLRVNMSVLTDDMRKQNIECTLLIENVEGDKAHTEFIGHRILPNAIKRMIRKGRTRLDLTIKAITKDEKVVTIKMLLVTRNIVQSSVSKAITAEARRFIAKKVSESSYEELSEAVLADKLSRELFLRLKKIFPLRTCQVSVFKLERFLSAVELRKIKESMEKRKRIQPKVEEEPEEDANSQKDI